MNVNKEIDGDNLVGGGEGISLERILNCELNSLLILSIFTFL